MTQKSNTLNDSQLIIFDWDGTLIDSHDYIIDSMLLAASALHLPNPSREQVSAIIGMSMLPAIQALFPQLTQQQIVQFRSVYTEHYNDQNRVQPQLFSGVYAALEQLLAKNYVLAIATGKRKPGLLTGLAQTNTSHFFSELRTADDCASKPSPEMVNSILSSLKIKAEHSVVIGDNVLDIQMAQAAAVKSVGVTTGSSSAEAMLKAGAAHCFENVTKVSSLF